MTYRHITAKNYMTYDIKFSHIVAALLHRLMLGGSPNIDNLFTERVRNISLEKIQAQAGDLNHE